MADPFGFIKYDRQDNPYRPISERIKDFNEMEVNISEAERRKQAARCMNCGVPHCHHGIFYGGGRAVGGCPNDNLIPEWQDLVYRNEDKMAFDRLTLTNPLPDFTGLVCPAPCELSCNEALHGQGITIRNNEHFIIEQGFKFNWVKTQGTPFARNQYKVAVVGSGPAGLAAAWRLNQLGYQVTVFEKADRPGGLCMYGIPNMKLPKEIVARRVAVMQAVGIDFKVNTEVGVDISQDVLKRQFDRIVVCIGAGTPRDLVAEGRETEGVTFAVDFLTQTTKRVLKQGPKANDVLAGKSVLVLGGGDTGNDCVASAIRQGATKIKQLEITPEPPTKRPDGNPWPEYPATKRVGYGQEEAAELFSEPLTDYEKTVTAVHGQNGQLKSVTIQKVKNFKPIAGTEENLDVDLVLLAMGFTGPQKAIFEALGIEKVYDDYRTNDEQIYVAGDARRGPSLVIWAIREGRLAAQRVAQSLEKIEKRQTV
ncbi:glutamate synthase subunit beta [Agrilactobacillus composti DSM 18527 = JCM 14202]|uniref:Glutamate synthase subunit beta n=1 Tax=Agrilactobacillus composti DSM 18527 = JCM 14202 TaxID=1423734 RepID=X0PDD3_9LACO|nr:glutamate synthase subunit beta [Agrilactobacillus composti]KRM36624.1 glutamate synthase subunit beta [Agrilactobacillus composti DSM 18527 = JCM 14202]GAF39044.1 glutamate synthase [Agrilactobacillus composti DSM 18527 = JCM 14202]